eukprot:978008_1
MTLGKATVAAGSMAKAASRQPLAPPGLGRPTRVFPAASARNLTITTCHHRHQHQRQRNPSPTQSRFRRQIQIGQYQHHQPSPSLRQNRQDRNLSSSQKRRTTAEAAAPLALTPEQRSTALHEVLARNNKWELLSRDDRDARA